MATAPSTMSYKRLTGRWERNDSTFAFAACIALRGGGGTGGGIVLPVVGQKRAILSCGSLQ
jgi:hypothetical protein